MKLLVTGGAGYIGSNVAYILCELGHEVVILDNLYSGHRWAIPAKALFVEGDVGHVPLLESLLREHRFDGILHFAAHTEVGESVENPAKYFRNNLVSSLALFETARRFAIPNLIFSSTAAVYGEPTSTQPLPESSALSPMNPYGASKLMAERILQDVAATAKGAMRFVILRYFNAAGARRDLRAGQATPRATHLVKVASEVAVGARGPLIVNGTDYATPDGTCLRDYVHVEDLAQAHVDALAYLANGGISDIFNVGYGKPSSVFDVIRSMSRAAGVELAFERGPRRPGDPSAVSADSSRIQRVLGWKPRFNDLDLICRTSYEWEKKMRTGGPVSG